MVAYLSKSDASEGFNHILNFLNGSSIKYALTVNPNIYVSCIKQFWNTVVVKHVNDVTRLQALVDKKKVVVTEAALREVLRLDDAEGVDYLPNEETFTELARMGYEKPPTKLTFYKAFFSSQWKFLIHTILQCMSAKRTSWNKFSLAMASAVICLSTGDLSTHTTKYTSPALTQKVFANMRRVGKGFFRVEPPLFEGMLVGHEVDEEGDADEHVEETTVQHIPPQSPQPKQQPQPQQQAADFLMSLLQEELDACATLTKRVENLECDKISQALEITKLKKRVKKLEKRNKVRVLKLRRLQKVGISQRIDTSDDIVMDDESNQGRMITEMDKDDAVVLMDDKEEDKETKVDESVQVQRRQAESQLEIYKIEIDHASKVLSMQEDKPAEEQEIVEVVTNAKLITKVVTAASETVTPASAIILAAEPQVPVAPIEQDEEYARKLHDELNKDIDWDEAIDHVKRKAKEDPAVKRYQVLKRKPQTEGQARKNMIMYLKNVAGFKMDYFKGMSYDDIQEEENRALQKINETLAERAAKKRKLDEEVEDLKRHLEIVPNEDDDVYTEATPLTRKVHVVNYEIIELNNKPHYKIIRADETHQLYERFSTTKPKNFSDDFLLTTLGEMFETPNPHYNFYNYTANFVSGEEVPTLKIYFRPDTECFDDAMDVKEICQVSNAAGEELIAAKQS
uniref:Xylulose kinase-1 n=1 Tax=Tanacetum cinerariifolium TaxID=118510 RepID=A0A6L2NK75_TANCI|nr:hypothetical protein [Tanacetum cinerariifolium]